MITDTVVTFEVRGAVRELFQSTDSMIIAGPAGTGKSMGALMWLHLMLLEYPGTKALLVRKVARSLSGTTLATFREKVASEAIQAGAVAFYGGSPQEPASFRYGNGSRIIVGGLDEPQKIMGSEVSIVMIDEAIETTPRDINMLRTRLRGAAATAYQHYRMILLTNPGHPKHHLRKAKMRMLHSRHQDNPSLWRDGAWTDEGQRYMAELEKLTGNERARLLEGRWVAAEGVIYGEYIPAVHEIPSFPVPSQWARYIVVDFGYVNPACIQWWAEDPDGRLYLYREMYQTQWTVERHAVNLLDHVTGLDGEWIEPRPTAVITDHDAEGRATLEEKTGLDTTAADKRVTIGLQAVRNRLKVAGDGKPRLYVMEDALLWRDEALDEAGKPCGTREEFPGYVWDKAASSKEGAEKEVPLKVNDHSMDCVRYLCAHLDLGESDEVESVGGFW